MEDTHTTLAPETPIYELIEAANIIAVHRAQILLYFMLAQQLLALFLGTFDEFDVSFINSSFVPQTAFTSYNSEQGLKITLHVSL